jgi:hypothetical protein
LPERVQPIVAEVNDFGREVNQIDGYRIVHIEQAPSITNALIGELTSTSISDAVKTTSPSVQRDYQALLSKARGVREALSMTSDHWEGRTPVTEGKEQAVAAANEFMGAAGKFSVDFGGSPDAPRDGSGAFVLMLGGGAILAAGLAMLADSSGSKSQTDVPSAPRDLPVP